MQPAPKVDKMAKDEVKEEAKEEAKEGAIFEAEEAAADLAVGAAMDGAQEQGGGDDSSYDMNGDGAAGWR